MFRAPPGTGNARTGTGPSDTIVSPAPNVEAVAAATIPRGSIQPMNVRSPFVRSVFSVAAKARDGPGHDDQDRDQDECGQDQVPE